MSPKPDFSFFDWVRVLEGHLREGDITLSAFGFFVRFSQFGTNGTGDDIKVSIRTLSGETNTGERTIQRLLARGRELGFIHERKRGWGDGVNKRPSVYCLVIPNADDIADDNGDDNGDDTHDVHGVTLPRSVDEPRSLDDKKTRTKSSSRTTGQMRERLRSLPSYESMIFDSVSPEPEEAVS